MLEAIEHFKRATEIDPDYALAWERLADIYTTARFVVDGELSDNWQQLSNEALTRAISLAPTSPAIVDTTAFRQVHLGQWRDAELTLNRGIGLRNRGHI